MPAALISPALQRNAPLLAAKVLALVQAKKR